METWNRAIFWLSRRLAAVFTLLLLMVGFAIFSVWIANDHPSPSTWVPYIRHRNFYLGLFLGMALCVLLIELASKGLPEYFAPMKYAVNTWLFFWFFIVSIVLVIVFVGMANALEPMDNQNRWHSLWLRVIQNPGGAFILITGVGTLYGVVLTLMGLREIRRTVNSFSELIDRVCDMAKKATDDNPVRILAYTPAIGYLAQPTRDWNKLYEALKRKTNGRPIANIICLREGDLEVWHKLFVGRRTLRGQVTLNQANEATRAANNLLGDLGEDSIGNPVSGTVCRLPWRYMPGFYTFLTRERAIIVTPLFLPFPKGAPREQQEGLPTVQMIGLETSDRAIIRDIEQMYDYYAHLPNCGLAESNRIVQYETLNSWVENPINAGLTIQPLLTEWLKAYIAAKDGPYAPMLTAESQVELSLSADIKTWGD